MSYFVTHKFSKPIYITRPLLPDIDLVAKKLEEVWNSRQLTNNGAHLLMLEKVLADRLQVPFLTIYNNGTSALMAGVKALGLSGEVITTPFTFPATPHVLTWNNINPIFCDIDPDTMNIDPDKIESMITPLTTGILPVHIFGTPCNVESIQKIADRHGLKVLYDAAHAFGVEVDGHGIGSYGDISMFSFHATKIFHTVEGGALAFKDENLKQTLDVLKNFGIKNEEEVIMPGINGKMDEIHSVIGLLVLDLLEGEIMKRKELTDVYRTCLKDVAGISYRDDLFGIKYNYTSFVIRIDEEQFGRSRDYVYDHFKEYNVFTRKYYSQLCSEYPHYRELPSANALRLPVASRIAKQVLTLPLYGELTPDDVEKICDIMLEIRG